MKMKKSNRTISRERRKRQKLNRTIWLTFFSSAALIILLFTLSSINPQRGDAVELMRDSSHVPTGTDPGPYNTNPPTSGRHYEESLEAGFYEENPYEYSEGYLVHSLEHGYVIFWYNCSILNATQCSQLKSQIKSVMVAADNYKVIAFPWESIDSPVVMTSWGKLHRFTEFESDAALTFVKQNRNKSPEPSGH